MVHPLHTAQVSSFEDPPGTIPLPWRHACHTATCRSYSVPPDRRCSNPGSFFTRARTRCSNREAVSYRPVRSHQRCKLEEIIFHFFQELSAGPGLPGSSSIRSCWTMDSANGSLRCVRPYPSAGAFRNRSSFGSTASRFQVKGSFAADNRYPLSRIGDQQQQVQYNQGQQEITGPLQQCFHSIYLGESI